MKYYNKFNKEGLFRSRDGMILGVFKGISDFFEVPVGIIRFAAVLIFFMSGFFPVTVLYFLAAFFMKPAPVIPLYTDDEREFYDSYMNSRHSALSRLKSTYSKLDRRIQRIEDVVTSREFDWDRRL